MGTLAHPVLDDRVINPASDMAAVTLLVGDLENMSALERHVRYGTVGGVRARRDIHRVLGRV